MSFNPKLLPPTVYEVYKHGPMAWILVIKTAIELKITNIDKLTNIAFFLHHPELNGRPLVVGETKLIAQWKGFRTLIAPLLQKRQQSRGAESHFTEVEWTYVVLDPRTGEP